MAHVLLVDDDATILDLLDFALLLDGHQVTRAPDGETALRLAREGAPDLVLLDVMMPGLDGLRVARQLRADPTTATTPIIMLTARRSDEDVWKGYLAGADSYIPKPFDLDILRAEMERLGLGAAAAAR